MTTVIVIGIVLIVLAGFAIAIIPGIIYMRKLQEQFDRQSALFNAIMEQRNRRGF